MEAQKKLLARSLSLRRALKPLPHNDTALSTKQFLGPPVERLEEGCQLFAVVNFSRGTFPQKRNGQRALGDLGVV